MHIQQQISATRPSYQVIDPLLYLVINPEQCQYYQPVELAMLAVAGGASVVQIRSKSMTDQDYTKIVNETCAVLRPLQVPVFVNDRVGVASSTEAHGIHIGQDDVSVLSARSLLGPDSHIGLTVRSISEARSATIEELSYISVGGVFTTHSKFNPDPPIGLDLLKTIVKELKSRGTTCPIIAISGITLENLSAVLAAGVDGVAVVSAICESKDPQSAAHQFRITIDEFIKQRHLIQ